MANLQSFIQAIAFNSERFLPVNNFRGRFLISDHGRLISIRGNSFYLVAGGKDTMGYTSVTMRNVTYKRVCRMHQLVGEHFCEMVKSDDWMAWNHKDGNKLNNHYTNLEYISYRENCAHARKTGLCNAVGEIHGQSKLTNEQVVEIYSMRNSAVNQTRECKRFNISRRQFGDILNGKAWQHITSDLP